MILLTLCYYHRVTRSHAMKTLCLRSLCSHLNVLTFSPLSGGCSEGLDGCIIIIIIINGTLARSLKPVVTECKEHTIHTQTQVVASRKPKEIKRTHEGEANFTT